MIQQRAAIRQILLQTLHMPGVASTIPVLSMISVPWSSLHMRDRRRSLATMIVAPSLPETRCLARRGSAFFCRLVLRHVFGVRVCPYRPDCNSGKNMAVGCQDRMCSNATCTCSVFGRIDAAFLTLLYRAAILVACRSTHANSAAPLSSYPGVAGSI